MDISGTQALLFSIHLGLAAQFKDPDFALSEGEAKSLALAWANVEQHFDFLQVSPKVKALLMFAGTAGTIYMPRVGRLIGRKRAAPRPQPAPAQQPGPRPPQPNGGNVYTIPGVGPAVL